MSETCTDFAPPEDEARFASDFKLIAFALRTRNRRGQRGKGQRGIGATGEPRDQSFGAAEDRESAYAAGVAAAMNVSFVAIRTISESAYRRSDAETAPAQHNAEFVRASIQQVPRRLLSAR